MDMFLINMQLRLMQNELVVEEVVRERSMKVSKEHHLRGMIPPPQRFI